MLVLGSHVAELLLHLLTLVSSFVHRHKLGHVQKSSSGLGGYGQTGLGADKLFSEFGLRRNLGHGLVQPVAVGIVILILQSGNAEIRKDMGGLWGILEGKKSSWNSLESY